MGIALLLGGGKCPAQPRYHTCPHTDCVSSGPLRSRCRNGNRCESELKRRNFCENKWRRSRNRRGFLQSGMRVSHLRKEREKMKPQAPVQLSVARPGNREPSMLRPFEKSCTGQEDPALYPCCTQLSGSDPGTAVNLQGCRWIPTVQQLKVSAHHDPQRKLSPRSAHPQLPCR